MLFMSILLFTTVEITSSGNCGIHLYPYVVLIADSKGTSISPKCAGTLLSNAWVLTSVKCCNSEASVYVARATAKESIQYVRRGFRNSDYRLNDKTDFICLLRLKNALPNNKYKYINIPKVKLNDDEIPGDGTTMTWSNDHFDKELRCTTVTLCPMKECYQRDHTISPYLRNNETFCAVNFSRPKYRNDDQGPNDKPRSLSGGPLICNNMQVGVTVQEPINTSPGVYTRVDAYLDFIKEIMENGSGCECVVFSATYGKEKGIFKSPDFPKPYSPNIDCLLYNFIAGPEEIIELSFLDFDIFKTHSDCIRGDYLKVFVHLESAAVNEYTPWETLLCGRLADVPTTLYSSGPGLVLEFHSGTQTNNATGFSGTFKFIDRRLFKTDGHKLPSTMCDYQFLSSDQTPAYGKFYSPRYPSSYPKNIRCSYRFRARHKERIRIVFEEVALEKGDLSCLNRADLIRVYDGKTADDPSIRVLCNEGMELEVLSTGPDLFIEFVANSDWPGQGFKARFQFQQTEDNSIDSNRNNRLGMFSLPTEVEPNVSETRLSEALPKQYLHFLRPQEVASS